MDKIIFQTFWTAPMESREKLQANLYIAGLSLAYAHRSGYIVRMHTDNKGYALLKGLGYDSIINDLEEIPKDINPHRFFAYPKYFAGKREPLGAVHTDFDVFLKQPCLDKFFTDNSIDLILQNKELFSKYGLDYESIRKRFKVLGFPESLPVHHLIASNVGTIGFNNQQLKDSYYKIYFDYIDYFKDKADKLEGLNTELMAEQITADYLGKNYNTLYLLPPSKDNWNYNVTRVADAIGYQHLQGGAKYNPVNIKRIIRILKDKFPDMYEKINKINI